MPNWIKIVGLLLTGTMNDAIELAKKGQQEVSDILYSLRLQLKIATVLPLLLLVTGVIIGANATTVSGETTGHEFILVAAIIATVMMGLLLIRGTFYGSILIAAGRATNNQMVLSLLPNTTEAKALSQKIAGAMAWITGVCLYAQVVPVWRAVGLSLIVATAMMGLAFLIASGKFVTKAGWYILLSFTVLAVVLSTLSLVSPRFSATIAEARNHWLGSTGETDAEKTLITRFENEKAAINEKAATKCEGKYCSEADRARVKELDAKLEQLRTGHYWENAGVVGSVASATTASTTPAPTTTATTTPAVTATATAAQPSTTPAPTSVVTRPTSPAGGQLKPLPANDPFAPLDNL